MSSPSNIEHNSVSEYDSSADSDDRPFGQQSIHDSDSEPSENSGSDRQVSESSCNSDSDRQVIGENSHSIRCRGKRNRQVSLVSDESSPEQRRRKPAVDLFTALPDSLFLHVLSFLPIVDAVKTQVLSKRCQYLWTYITSLVFSIRNAGRCDRDFVAFVDKTLVLSNCSKIKKLGVQFGYAPDYESSVDLWTQFAAGKRAEELQLAFEDAVDPYLLPQFLYTNSSFKTLQFNTCDVMPEGVVRWNSLKRLSIGHANLSEDVIQKILAGSPVLEILELYRCLGFTRLHVNNAIITKSSYGCREYFRDELGNLDGKHYWSSRKKPFVCLMFRLKKVKLIGLVKSRVDDYLTFVQFILMNARVLQKMVIDAQMRGYNWQKEFTQFPRSSPDAVVMFCQ